MSMKPYARCALTISRAPVFCSRWLRTYPRPYATDAKDAPSEPAWFRDLRTEMLARKLPTIVSNLDRDHDFELESALSPFLPKAWKTEASGERLPLGHHLVYFNPAVPADQLLPDGTDAIHSPGPPFMRRMWTGGKLRVNPSRYYTWPEWSLDDDHVCWERIADVQLRGQGDAEKIFLTIERRFASMARLEDGVTNRKLKHDALQKAAIEAFSRQAHGSGPEQWGDASLMEERNLVFMKDRPSSELEAFRAGTFAPVRYLQPPGEAEFSHTLTPTPQLLSRFSSLTDNAHGIHLDAEYARNVEGHRDLLVHGPLTLTLMLTQFTSHLRKLDGSEIFHSIEYRNLAPLYSGEKLTLCGRSRPLAQDGKDDVWDVWIQGPTGLMAVKGTIRTTKVVRKAGNSINPSKRQIKHKYEDDDWRSLIKEAQPKRKALVDAFDPSTAELAETSRQEDDDEDDWQDWQEIMREEGLDGEESDKFTKSKPEKRTQPEVKRQHEEHDGSRSILATAKSKPAPPRISNPRQPLSKQQKGQEDDYRRQYKQEHCQPEKSIPLPSHREIKAKHEKHAWQGLMATVNSALRSQRSNSRTETEESTQEIHPARRRSSDKKDHRRSFTKAEEREMENPVPEHWLPEKQEKQSRAQKPDDHRKSFTKAEERGMANTAPAYLLPDKHSFLEEQAKQKQKQVQKPDDLEEDFDWLRDTVAGNDLNAAVHTKKSTPPPPPPRENLPIREQPPLDTTQSNPKPQQLQPPNSTPTPPRPQPDQLSFFAPLSTPFLTRRAKRRIRAERLNIPIVRSIKAPRPLLKPVMSDQQQEIARRMAFGHAMPSNGTRTFRDRSPVYDRKAVEFPVAFGTAFGDGDGDGVGGMGIVRHERVQATHGWRKEEMEKERRPVVFRFVKGVESVVIRRIAGPLGGKGKGRRDLGSG